MPLNRKLRQVAALLCGCQESSLIFREFFFLLVLLTAFFFHLKRLTAIRGTTQMFVALSRMRPTRAIPLALGSLSPETKLLPDYGCSFCAASRRSRRPA